MRALVVEDEPIVRTAMGLLLESWDLTADLAASTTEAVAVSGRSGCPDVIIADYRLVDGDTGWRAIEAVRRVHGREVPAVIVTGDTAAERLRQLSAIGVPVFHKPVNVAAMRATVERLIAPAAADVRSSALASG